MRLKSLKVIRSMSIYEIVSNDCNKQLTYVYNRNFDFISINNNMIYEQYS